MQYESTFNAIDNILRNEAGCSNELDYIEQTSWLLSTDYYYSQISTNFLIEAILHSTCMVAYRQAVY